MSGMNRTLLSMDEAGSSSNEQASVSDIHASLARSAKPI